MHFLVVYKLCTSTLIEVDLSVIGKKKKKNLLGVKLSLILENPKPSHNCLHNTARDHMQLLIILYLIKIFNFKLNSEKNLDKRYKKDSVPRVQENGLRMHYAQ